MKFIYAMFQPGRNEHVKQGMMSLVLKCIYSQ